jgi:hypothetical protein
MIIKEPVQPLQEALDELKEAYRDVAIWAGHREGWQAAGAQAVQAMTECTRRLREISAEYYPVEDDEDDA